MPIRSPCYGGNFSNAAVLRAVSTRHFKETLQNKRDAFRSAEDKAEEPQLQRGATYVTEISNKPAFASLQNLDLTTMTVVPR
jgi:hypothetical protein